MTPRMRLAVRLWPWVVAMLVLTPTLAPGYVLSYDMVFVPDLALRGDFLGLGTGVPRAVPSDAVVSVVDEVVPGMLLQKLVLFAALILAGAGVTRLLPSHDGFAKLAATSVYVWNPFVAERLGIGHWPLLLAYAALPWLIEAARRLRAGRGGYASLVLWLALAAMSASGGLMAALVAVSFVVGTSQTALRRAGLVILAAVVVNLPWLVAGLVKGAVAVSDPAGVEAFAARGEGALPAWLTVVGLGGIWNAEVVPVSRSGWAPVAWMVVLGLVCAAGVRAWWTATARRDVAAYLLCGTVGLLVAGAGMYAPEAMAALVSQVPGAGVVRDGARYLALLAPLEAVLFGFGAGRLAQASHQRVADVALAMGAMLAPLALMPDMAWGLAGGLRPVQYPAEYAVARERVVEAAGQEGAPDGALLVLPFTAYRAPDWNHGRKTLDPLGRYLPLDYVASDDLYVSGRRIAGEDPRARDVLSALARSRPPAPAPLLVREDISWVAVDRTAESALGRPDLTVPAPSDGLLHDGQDLRVWSLEPGASGSRSDRGRVLALAVAWTVCGGLVLFCLATLVRRGGAWSRKVMGRPSRW